MVIRKYGKGPVRRQSHGGPDVAPYQVGWREHDWFGVDGDEWPETTANDEAGVADV
jgi:hypothetical protein